MKYTKPWTLENSVTEDQWLLWLSANAIEDLEYHIIYKDSQLLLNFLDVDRAQEFALEFGL